MLIPAITCTDLGNNGVEIRPQRRRNDIPVFGSLDPLRQNNMAQMDSGVLEEHNASMCTKDQRAAGVWVVSMMALKKLNDLERDESIINS